MRVTGKEIEKYWETPPPARSEACAFWLAKIEGGWVPNRRVRQFGYYEAAAFFGVYLWEYLHVLYPAICARKVSP